MALPFYSSFTALLWKNWVTKRRAPVGLLIKMFLIVLWSLATSYAIHGLVSKQQLLEDAIQEMKMMLSGTAAVMALVFMFIVLEVVGLVVEEKTTRNREQLRIIGVPESAIATSWIVLYALIVVVIGVCTCVGGLLLSNVTALGFWGFVTLHMIALGPFAYFLS